MRCGRCGLADELFSACGRLLTCGDRGCKAEAMGPFRTRPANTRRATALCGGLPPRLACQALPGPTAPALRSINCALLAGAGRQRHARLRPGRRGLFSAVHMRWHKVGVVGLGRAWHARRGGDRCMRKPLTCVRVTSPERLHGPGLVAPLTAWNNTATTTQRTTHPPRCSTQPTSAPTAEPAAAARQPPPPAGPHPVGTRSPPR